jgi:hypothetical protein
MLKEWGVFEISVLGWGFHKISKSWAEGAYFGIAWLAGHYPTQEVAIDLLAQLETWKIQKWQCPNGKDKLATTSVFFCFLPPFGQDFAKFWAEKIMILTYTKDFSWKKNDPNLLDFKAKKKNSKLR